MTSCLVAPDSKIFCSGTDRWAVPDSPQQEGDDILAFLAGPSTEAVPPMTAEAELDRSAIPETAQAENPEPPATDVTRGEKRTRDDTVAAEGIAKCTSSI